MKLKISFVLVVLDVYHSTVNFFNVSTINWRSTPKLSFQNNNYTKIAIIGAGMAGLAAATTLQQRGLKDFIIFEAQNRPGGRVHSIQIDNEQIVELGAQWIHGTCNPLYKLAAEHNLISPIKSEEGGGLYVRDNGDKIDRDLVRIVDFQIGSYLQECEQFINAATDYPKSIGDYLTRNFSNYLTTCRDSPDIKEIKMELFDWHVRFQIIDNSCKDLAKLSAKGWGRYECVDDQAHINLICGYEELVRILAGNLRSDAIRLATPITQINCQNNIIELTTENGKEKFYCDHLILSASLGVLKNSLKIHPSLPYLHSSSIQQLGFDAIGKIFLVYDYKWWDFDGVQFIWRKDTVIEDVEQRWTRMIQGFDPVLNAPKVLLGWVAGQGVNEMEGLSEEQIGRHCTDALRRFLPMYNVPQPCRILRTKWLKNKWIQGGYSHITSNCDKMDLGMHQLSQPIFIDDKLRILIAGEGAHSSHYSTAHGAFESGQEQAEFLAAYLLNSTSKM